MKKTIAALTAAATLGVPGVAAAQRVVFYLNPSQAARVVLPGRAPNLRATVLISSRQPQVVEKATSTAYGFGVVIRLFQTGQHFFLRAGNASGTRVRIVVRYELLQTL